MCQTSNSICGAAGETNRIMATKTFHNIPREKQDRVLRAAQIEFAKLGYSAANINDICERAKISNGALYKYFKNKADLYEAVIAFQIEGKDEYMRGVLERDTSSLEKIRMLMENKQTEVEARNNTFRILLQLGASDMNDFAKKVARNIEATSFENIGAILAQGIKKGEIRDDIDLEMTAHLINSLSYSLYNGYVSEFHRIRLEEFFHIPFSDDELSEERLVDRFMGWLKDLIAVEGQQSR